MSSYRYLMRLVLLIILGICLSFPIAIGKAALTKDYQSSQSPSIDLFNQLGNHSHPISTNSKLAQTYFDQGLTLAFGFNHAEASRYFNQAAQLDPDCAMCYWGIAYVLGPNINAPMADESIPNAWEALQKATSLSKKASKKEQSYIQALAHRYTNQPLRDRSSLDLSYAKAMRSLAQEYPDDLDAATLFAEALMDTMPWDYWQQNGEPKPETVELLDTLESILQRNPNHPGANHLYIHAVEKERPQLGIDAADRLGNLVPDSGHLVHMPSHIYIRVGRYHDAVVANQKAIQADVNYLQRPHPESIYTLGYMPHNQHFLWFGALMSGQSKIATEAAQKTAEVDLNLIREPDSAGALQHYYLTPLYTKVRFAQWDNILTTPAPAPDLKYPQGIWHYARGMAFIAKDEVEKANSELEELEQLKKDPSLEKIKIWSFNSTASVLEIASQELAAKIAAHSGDYDRAIAKLEKAIELEDSLVYTEPPDWYAPTRQLLGTLLMEANRPKEAEQVFRADLKIYPQNGWSLHGLAQSLVAQGKIAEAKRVRQEFEEAWQYADITLASR